MSKTSAVDFEQLLLAMLQNDAGLSALVGKKVFALVISPGTRLPCVNFQRISGEPANCLDGHSGLENIAMQLEARGHLYAEAKEVAKAVRAAMTTENSIWGAQLVMDQDLYDETTKVFLVSMEYEIWFLENA